MLWLFGYVPDSGHLEVQTKEPKQLLCFLCGLLNTVGGGLQGHDGTGDVPPLKEEMSWLAEVCQDRNTQCGLGMAAHGWGMAAGRMEPGAQTLRLSWASSVPLTRLESLYMKTLIEGEEPKSPACFGGETP